jgi:hypothetical protein
MEGRSVMRKVSSFVTPTEVKGSMARVRRLWAPAEAATRIRSAGKTVRRTTRTEGEDALGDAPVFFGMCC